jgi:hypothetical protein
MSSDLRKHTKVFIVLGGGLKLDGSLPKYVEERVNFAVQCATQCDTVLFSSRYSLNIPPKLCKLGFAFSEAKQMLDQYERFGGVSDNLFLENASTDTIGSAFFLRVAYDWLIKDTDVFIITSDFHAKKVDTIFNKIWLELSPELNVSSKQVISVKSNALTEQRIDHETQQTKKFICEYGAFQSLREFQSHMFKYHDNYNKSYNSNTKKPNEMLY